MKRKAEPSHPEDNCGRRRGRDRRKFSYTAYIPERRRGDDRRVDADRRQSRRMKAAPDVLISLDDVNPIELKS